MLEGFTLDGRQYSSTIDIVSMYVDHFPQNDMSRDIAAKHGVPIYGSIREALLAGGEAFDLDGIILIGEHGVYPFNEIGQELYPRRIFFEECLNVMLEFDRIVPVYTDKGYAVIQEDVEWMYKQIKTHHIPFMSSSVVPFAQKLPVERPFPNGAPLYKMFGFSYGSLERYVYHTLEMMQSVAEQRAYGETGIRSIKSYKNEEALEKLFSEEWGELYRACGRFINLCNVETFPRSLHTPIFIEVNYVDGLKSGILYCDWLASKEMQTFGSAYQVSEHEQPICMEFRLQGQKPYSHFGRLTLEIEKFFHTGRPPFPVERSLLTTGGLDAFMRSHHSGEEVFTPHLEVRY
jgi:hypothetical protein